MRVSWLVDRDRNCPDAPVDLTPQGPVSRTTSVPCDQYEAIFEDLPGGDYKIRFRFEDVFATLEPIPITCGEEFVIGPYDVGECSITGCGPNSVGCNDDGVCSPDDDCTCADCVNTLQCGCDNDSICVPYFEPCSCGDCAANPACTM
ncbi:MAG: hypothetical protein AAGN82_30595 [Myxococcota bacterium]